MAATRIGVVLSGTGRTLVNILEHIRDGKLDAEVVCVISDREGVRGVDHARAAGLPTLLAPDSESTFTILQGYDVELVCLCGYLRLLKIPDSHRRRVLNIHPALLPKFGGEGFYGHRVHDAVLAAGESESGCTVHYCDDEYDRGAILLQKRVPVLEDDTADTLATRVFDAECVAYPEAIKIWAATQ
jgi:phosphoribosylglycinamide formyltransferase-1